MVGCNLEKVTKEKILSSKLKDDERIIGKFLNYDLKLKYGSSTGVKLVYLTNQNRVIIHDDGGGFSSEKIYASDIYGISKYNKDKGYSILLDYSYSATLSINISLIDLILFNEYFYKYLNFSQEPTILITKGEYIVLKSLAINSERVTFLDGKNKELKIELNKIRDFKYGNRVLNIVYKENDILNKFYIFNISAAPVEKLRLLLNEKIINY